MVRTQRVPSHKPPHLTGLVCVERVPPAVRKTCRTRSPVACNRLFHHCRRLAHKVIQDKTNNKVREVFVNKKTIKLSLDTLGHGWYWALPALR